MDWLGLIMQLLTAVLAKTVDADEVSAVIGRPIDKDKKPWRIEPNQTYAGRFFEAFVYIEDLAAGRGLVTTIELQLAEPWHATPEALERALGSPGRSVSATHPGRTGTLIFDVKRDERRGSVILSVRLVEDNPSGTIEISQILVRRIYD